MIVFDLDDTLYKEADFVASGCRAIAAAAHEACPTLTYANALSIINAAQRTSAGFDALLAEIQRLSPGNSFDIKELLHIYRFHRPDISLSPEVREVLELLKRDGVPLGLITDGRTITQRNKIEALGLQEFISPENIIISEEIGADKKSPESFQEMMRRNPEETRFVYVGDNPAKDFLWPNRLGWMTVMLLDTTGRNIFPQTVPQDAEPICILDKSEICASDYAPQHKIPSLRDIAPFVT